MIMMFQRGILPSFIGSIRHWQVGKVWLYNWSGWSKAIQSVFANILQHQVLQIDLEWSGKEQ